MRFLVLLLCALVAQPAVAAAKKKKPAAAKKARPAKPAKATKTPEPKPEPEPQTKKATVLLDTNPATVAVQLEKTLAESYVVGVADPALPEDVDRDAVMRAAKKARAVAVVTARYANGVWILRTWSGADGGVLAEATYKAPKEGPKVVVPKPTLAKLLAAAMKAESSAGAASGPETTASASSPKEKEKKPASTPPSPPPEKERKEEKEEKEEPTESEQTATPAADEGEKPQALAIECCGHFLNRRWFYEDDLFGALSRYTQPLAPRLAFNAEFFPGAFATKGAGAWFGLTGGIDFLFGVTAVAADGTRYPTSALRVKANVAGRIPIADRLEIFLSFGYALTTYAIGGEAATKPNVPDVGYSALRPAARLSLRLFGPVWIRAEYGHQILLNTGQLGSAQYFPRLTGGGLDLNAGLMIRPLRYLQFRATFDYQRYWFSMNPEVGDPYIAGGATDDSLGFSVCAAFTL